MARQFSLPYQIPPVMLLSPALDAAGRIGGYRSLRNAMKSWLICRVAQANAAPVLLTPLQATSSTGTGSKPLGLMPIWLNNNTAASDALVPQMPAANFLTDATLADKIVIFELEGEAVLDVLNGFQHITVQTGASNAANITEANLYALLAYQQKNPPSTYV